MRLEYEPSSKGAHLLPMPLLISALDGSGAVHTVLPWGAFGGQTPGGALHPERDFFIDNLLVQIH